MNSTAKIQIIFKKQMFSEKVFKILKTFFLFLYAIVNITLFYSILHIISLAILCAIVNIKNCITAVFLLFLLDAINVNKYLHSSIKYANYSFIFALDKYKLHL